MGAPPSIEHVRVDVAIVGGGVAGAWLLSHLHDRGYAALLCEGASLGAGQTIASQGIIHGGLKYGLDGSRLRAGEALAAMPAIWRACLRGERAPNLSGARILAQHQVLIADGGLASRLAGIFAESLLRGRVAAVDRVPAPLAAALGASFRGAVYQLDEPIVDVRSVLGELRRAHLDAILAVDPVATRPLDDGAAGIEVQSADGRRLRILCDRVALCAGAGNEALGRLFSPPSASMQRRPLRMVMLRGPLPPIHAHCLGTGSTPRLTVTTHLDRRGRVIWYLGGALAESGVDRDDTAQARFAREELSITMPAIDTSTCDVAVLSIDRAEGRQPSGARPEGPVLIQRGAVTRVWPTKLAFAPLAAAIFEEQLVRDGVLPGRRAKPDTAGWPRPALADHPWDEERPWN
jgi:glycine/D-amino acid oxidase-like deaminating enzyme